MPELPEIASRAREMNCALPGKVIQGVEVNQPKCLNLSATQLDRSVKGKRIEAVFDRGKWIILKLEAGWIAINMGMGGELLLVNRQTLPPKVRLIVDFSDHTCLTVNYWWFGYFHYSDSDPRTSHPMVSKLGMNALEIPIEEFRSLITRAKKRSLKTVLLDQTQIAGIGNAYIHDILFLAKLHPSRACAGLSAVEVDALFHAIHAGLELPLSRGGAFYELNLFGEKGGFSQGEILVGYREGKPCPVCGTGILKIRTAATSSYLCPACQK